MRGLSFGEMLEYVGRETVAWRDWLAANTSALDVPCDLEGCGTARDLVRRIVIVQVRYAQRFWGLPETDDAELADSSTAELFALAEQSLVTLRSFAVSARDPDWEGNRRAIFGHVIFHSIRRWTQLAMLLRQRGYSQDWAHDFISSASQNGHGKSSAA